MSTPRQPRIAILYPGDADARRTATAQGSRFAAVFSALAQRGALVEPAVYHDELRDEVRSQLEHVDAVLVWVNPIEDGRDRRALDAMLREVSARGVFVSAHPEVILALGTKEVLYTTRAIGWGCDTHLYTDMEQMRRELPARLASGEARVLKQHRGNGGNGVWKVALADPAQAGAGIGAAVKVRHAQRGSAEETMALERFVARCSPYFAHAGRMIDQAYQPRLAEGMTRCYLVHDTVAGFGHQAINALYPPPPGAPPEAAPAPGPRLYHPVEVPAFQALRRRLEDDWLPALQRLLGLERERLPVLWDCDFLLGPRTAAGADSYVLCEINVSCVSPFPDSALPLLAGATVSAARAAARRRA